MKFITKTYLTSPTENYTVNKKSSDENYTSIILVGWAWAMI